MSKGNGRLAQLGEHLPYKQGVIGSSPITTTIFLRPGSSVGQNAALSRRRSTVRARSRSPFFYNFIVGFIAQLVEQGTENPRVSGSIPLEATNSLWWMQRSWLERQFVALEVVSSNLIFHPIIFHQFYIHWTVAKR